MLMKNLINDFRDLFSSHLHFITFSDIDIMNLKILLGKRFRLIL